MEEKTHEEKNVAMAALSYLGILIIIPLITESRKEAFVKFHIKQGIVLLITSFIAFFVSAVPIIEWILAPFIALAILIMVIIGLVNALGGKEKELPLIGKYSEKINF